MRARDDGILWRNRCSTNVDASIACFVIGVCISKANAAQGVAIKQALIRYLIVQAIRQNQFLAIILLAQAAGGDGKLLLVVDCELETFIAICNCLGDCIFGISLFAVICRALNSLVDLPAVNGCTGQGVGVANLEDGGRV